MTHNDFETWLQAPQRPPLVMGVLNVTPDSFSEGGAYADKDAAVGHGLTMISEGVDLIDIGGESTKPGSQPVAADEQIRRVVPVIREIIRQASRADLTISIDTRSADVAAAALDAGAAIINDISAGRDDPAMLALAATRGCPIILMHMQGSPATMQAAPTYENVVDEVMQFLEERIAAACAAGIAAHRILIDPGIGFGKSMEHNLTLLRELKQFGAIQSPLVVGTSRKKFIGTITNEPDPRQRTFGSLAAAAWSVVQGASIVRVHDVRATRQAIDVISHIIGRVGL